MPWNRNDSDPLEARRRQLAEAERLLSEQRKRLTEQLQQTGETSPVKPAAPPVWRMEEDASHERPSDPAPTRKRNLARQRQRDMVVFFLCIGLFLIVVLIVLWIAHVHNSAAPVTGA